MTADNSQYCCRFEEHRQELQTEDCEPAHLLNYELGQENPNTIARQTALCIAKKKLGICQRPGQLDQAIKDGRKFIKGHKDLYS